MLRTDGVILNANISASLIISILINTLHFWWCNNY
nr:hypothetical protein [Metamycoplasma hominis]